MTSLRTRTGQHARRILRVQSQPIPWAWMLICGLATGIPLWLGYQMDEILPSVYGGLAGYLIALTDHEGTFRHRLLMVTVAAVVGWSAFAMGLAFQNSPLLFLGATFFLVYVCGLFGGHGAELERLTLLGIVEFILASYLSTISSVDLFRMTFFVAAAFLTVLLGLVITRLTLQRTPGHYVRIIQALKELATRSPQRHFYAATFAGTTLLSIWIVHQMGFERGYWTIITVLLVMRPDASESRDRIVQRLFGTLLGVLTGTAVLYFSVPIPGMILICATCATLVPYVWKKNYWLVAFLVTNLVLTLLNLALGGHAGLHLAAVRVKATILGCAIALTALVLSRAIQRSHIFIPPN